YNMLYPKEHSLILALVPGREALDYLVLSHGLESVLTSTYESLHWSRDADPDPVLRWHEQLEPERSPEVPHPARLALQELLARLAPAQRTALRAQVSRWARQPAEQQLLAFLFQAKTLSADELQSWLELNQESAVRSWFAPAGLMLWTQLRDPWLIEQLAGMYLEHAKDQGWRERFGVMLEQSLFRLVDRAGSAAAAGLGLVVRAGETADLRAAAAEALCLLNTRRALEVMAGLLDSCEGPRLAGVFRAHPARGVAVLLARAAGAPEGAGAGLRLVEDILLAHPGLEPEDPPKGAAAVLWQSLTQVASEPEPVADPALPEVFWRDKDLLPDLPLLGLSLLPGAESFTLRDPGVRPYIFQKPPISDARDAETLAGLKKLLKQDTLLLSKLDDLSQATALDFFNSSLQSQDGYSFDPAAQASVKVWHGCDAHEFASILARFGLAALPGLIALSWIQPGLFRGLARIRSPRLGYVMAAGLRLPFESFGTRHNDPLLAAPDICRHWLCRHPFEAALGLIPVACGKAGPARELARRALCMLWLEGPQAPLARAAAAYGSEAEAVLRHFFAQAADADPSESRPGLPGWCDARRLPPPLLTQPHADGAQAFSLAARNQLASQLARCTPFFPAAAIRSMRELCMPESLAGFSWKLFELWLDQGAEARHDWMLYALGHLGDRACIQGLLARIETWPEQKPRLEKMTRAESGLEALSCLARSEAASRSHALAAIQRLALTCPHQILRDAAQTRLEEIAAESGQSLAELEDESVPDYGLNSHATQRLIEVQILRLEAAMVSQQRWTVERFRRCVAGHSLLGRLAEQLVWGLWSPGRTLPQPFCLQPEGWLTLAGELLEPDLNRDRVSLLHPLLFQAELWGWLDLALERDWDQPFEQLTREVFWPEPADFVKLEPPGMTAGPVPSQRLQELMRRPHWRGEYECLSDDPDYEPYEDDDEPVEIQRRLGGWKVLLTSCIPPWRFHVYPEIWVSQPTIREVRENRYYDHPPAILDPVSFSELKKEWKWLTAKA
ncbi:MAG TPA: DUF4132 domain-containing protein, partial [Candidatus Obscuribacterales bacterium]